MHMKILTPVLFFAFCLTPLEKVQAEREDVADKEQPAAVAEEKAEIAREEVEIAEEAAALAEKKAEVARKEARVTRGMTARTSQLEQELAALKAKETERGLVLTLGDVLFESNKADLKPEGANLSPLVTFLKENPERHVLIEGHTDSTGPESYNLELSQQRAATVRNFLVLSGIAPERITARGYGQAYPVAPNDTEAGRQENRRVEIVVLRKGELVTERK